MRAFLDRLKMFALFSKHCGFSEEREWRVVYMRDRDEGKALDKMLDYATGRNGIEPKLKFKVAPIAGLTRGRKVYDDRHQQSAHELIEALPDNATWQDLESALELRADVEAGIADANAGRFTELEQLRRDYGLN